MKKEDFQKERVCKLIDRRGNWKHTVVAIYDNRGFFKWCLLALAHTTPKSRWLKLQKQETLEIFEREEADKDEAGDYCSVEK